MANASENTQDRATATGHCCGGQCTAAEPTVEYTCGHCGAALMRVDQSEPHSLLVHCTSCDAYNSTAD
jgi:hypothetical protein